MASVERMRINVKGFYLVYNEVFMKNNSVGLKMANVILKVNRNMSLKTWQNLTNSQVPALVVSDCTVERGVRNLFGNSDTLVYDNVRHGGKSQEALMEAILILLSLTREKGLRFVVFVTDGGVADRQFFLSLSSHNLMRGLPLYVLKLATSGLVFDVAFWIDGERRIVDSNSARLEGERLAEEPISSLSPFQALCTLLYRNYRTVYEYMDIARGFDLKWRSLVIACSDPRAGMFHALGGMRLDRDTLRIPGATIVIDEVPQKWYDLVIVAGHTDCGMAKKMANSREDMLASFPYLSNLYLQNNIKGLYDKVSKINPYVVLLKLELNIATGRFTPQSIMGASIRDLDTGS